MDRRRLIESMVKLGEMLQTESEEKELIVSKAFAHNPWFTPDNIRYAFNQISRRFLVSEALENWLMKYPDPANTLPRKVGLIMAGNIPFVGFHDLLCVLASGHEAIVKMSDKDPYLIPFLLDLLQQIDPAISSRVRIVEKLSGFQAVIATGSNQAALHFEAYFTKYPHIIRRNRNAVAVLDGTERAEQLQGLTGDIFRYFGLGCRSISKIYVPEGIDFDPFISALKVYDALKDHHKYRNNLDYNAALHILGGTSHISLEHIILVESEEIISRIACLHYQYYSSLDSLRDHLQSRMSEIQCISSEVKIPGVATIPLGSSQSPALDDYADGIDTMQFLHKGTQKFN